MSRTLTKRLEYVEQYRGISRNRFRKTAECSSDPDLTAKGQIVSRRNFAHSQAAYEELVKWAKQ